MQITIQSFGVLCTVLGQQEHVLHLPASATVEDALNLLGAQYPDLDARLSSIACAIGDIMVQRTIILQDCQTLVLIPPVSGG